ncbi:BufA1 family periplasmic bufferin-type metallophore [Aquabacterium sp.]|uniref:BufA1 family periplasmic bufferin-type metallophore n=1 Tax=Aquabacterium sp. TaxID=1872578 RepID=UPI003D6CA7AC
MNQRHLLSSALASVMALGLVSQASAEMGAEKGKEKCFGVAKAGENSCANLSGSHSCAGQSTKDKSAEEWKLVAKGTCAKLGGLSAEEAKVALAKSTDKK